MKKFNIAILFFALLLLSGSTHFSESVGESTQNNIFNEANIKYNLNNQLLINQFASSKELENAIIGFALLDLTDNTIISEYNSSTSITPASVQKAITTATALEILGADTTFSTDLNYSGTLVKNQGTLKGNIVIKGGGDPCLGTSAYQSFYPKEGFMAYWVSSIISLGIDTIEGDIIADASIFEEENTPGGWAWIDIPAYYGSAPFGLCAYDNQFNLIFNPRRKGKYLVHPDSMNPVIPGLYAENKIASHSMEDKYLDLIGAYYSNHRIIKGNLSKTNTSLELKGSIPDPPYLLAWQLMENLKKKGIIVKGSALTSRMLASENKKTVFEQKLICRLNSPPLKEIVNRTNLFSINLYAELLMAHIGHKKSGLASTKAGIKATNIFWESKGLNIQPLFISDGSGLSRENAVNSKFLVNMMSYMYLNSKLKESFFTSLPIAGISGTLRSFCNATEAEGKIYAKSGTMTRIKCYAGYITTRSGKNMAFSLLVNNFSCTSSALAVKMQTFLTDIYKNN